MMDTQWPRFEVFEQERPDGPHQNAGAVHAPDAEMALQNARDVFVRRPDCHSLWVAPASAICTRTAEELLADPGWLDAPAPDAAPVQTYQVFYKLTQRQGQNFVTHAGPVEARSPNEAVRLALARMAGSPVYVWWVVPEAAITRSDPAEAEVLFGPARDKAFRMPNFYHVRTLLREATAGTPGFDPDEVSSEACEVPGTPRPSHPAGESEPQP
jgi:ring-1,2-phenylacetyl-CoA epoxidase subunit PaaB